MAVWISRNAIRLSCKGSAASLNHAIQIREFADEPRIIKDPTIANLKRGTGGRSSFSGIVCTVFGASGFVGRYVCNRLGKIGTQLIVPYRSDFYDVKRLKLCGDLGQVLFHPFDLRDEESIYKSIKYSNVVINLIGREYETKNFSFEDVNVEGARTIARICKDSGVERLIHFSCLNADPHPTPILLPNGSQYLKSKWEGEQAVREEFPEATIVRPSLIYGQEDRFFQTYLNTMRLSARGMPLWKKGEQTIKQPVHVGDVAGGVTALVRDPRTAGKTYQFLGPDRYKLSDLVDWIRSLIEVDPEEYGYRRRDIDWAPVFKLKVSLIEAISVARPMWNLHWEGLELEHVTDVAKEGVPTLEDLGICPEKMENRIRWELRPYRVDISTIDVIPEHLLPKAPQPIT